jgi:flagellar hook-length control protein FliK
VIPIEAVSGLAVGAVRKGEGDWTGRTDAGAEFLLLIEDGALGTPAVIAPTVGAEAPDRETGPDGYQGGAADARTRWDAALGGLMSTPAPIPLSGTDIVAAPSDPAREGKETLGRAEMLAPSPSAPDLYRPSTQHSRADLRIDEPQAAGAAPQKTRKLERSVLEPGPGYLAPHVVWKAGAGESATPLRPNVEGTRPGDDSASSAGSAESRGAPKRLQKVAQQARGEAETSRAVTTTGAGRDIAAASGLPFPESAVLGQRPEVGALAAVISGVAPTPPDPVEDTSRSAPTSRDAGAAGDRAGEPNGASGNTLATTHSAASDLAQPPSPNAERGGFNPADYRPEVGQRVRTQETRGFSPAELRTSAPDKASPVAPADGGIGPSRPPDAVDPPASTAHVPEEIQAATYPGERQRSAEEGDGKASRTTDGTTPMTLTVSGKTAVQAAGPSGPHAMANDPPPGSPPVLPSEDAASMMTAHDLLPTSRGPEPTVSTAAFWASADTGRSVAQQMVSAVHAEPHGGFELHLSPEELGKVRLSLQVSEGAISVAIHAERPEILDLLRRHVDLLEREFREAGFTSMSFTFGHGSSDDRGHRLWVHDGAMPELGLASPTDSGPQIVGKHVHSSSLLDLRL